MTKRHAFAARMCLVMAAAWGAMPAAAHAGEPVTLDVRLDRSASTEAMSGRLVVFLLREGSRVGPGAEPAEAPFYDDPQPMYAMEVRGLAPGDRALVGAQADAFPGPASDLPAGTYRVQAVLDAQRESSDWSREPGNVYSEVVTLVRDPAKATTLELALTKRVEPREAPPASGAGFEVVEIPSKLLTAFRGRPAVLRAGVVPPTDLDASRAYPAVYVVPGFGGDHMEAGGAARRRAALKGKHEQPGRDDAALARQTYLIVLDPESGNGHTLMADSANNGPVGRALTEELIPALEARYRLIPKASARLLMGHSSGGWSSVWLAITYPGVFGACWAGAPDPLDFHALQKTNIYEDASLYVDASGAEIASNQKGGRVLMTTRAENLWEEVRGPGNSSGQQWDSWQAVFGPRDERGNPAALYDPVSGAIDARVARAYSAFDVTALLRRDPERLAPIFRDHVRIIVGEADEWNLCEGVRRLRDALRELGVVMDGVAGFGRITLVPGATHGSVMMASAYRARDREMLQWLRDAGHAPAAEQK